MEKYLHYNVEDFAANESFINWVNNSNEKDISFWNQWLAENPSKQADIDDAVQLVLLLSQKESNNFIKQQEIWSKIKDATTDSTKSNTPKVLQIDSPDTNRKGFLRYLLPIAVAAVVGLVVFVNFNGGKSLQEYNTDSTFTVVMLPDGSKLTLATDSKASIDEQGWKNERKVNLTGEGYFQVKKGEQFTVVTDNGNVEVLGTSFNVVSRKKDFKVECETGKVRVTQKGKEIAILTPNQAVISNNNEVRKITNQFSKPKNQKLYSSQSISTIFKDIENEFGVSIEYDTEGKEEVIFTGSVVFDDLESALQIFSSLGMKYEINGKIVKIVNE